MKITHPFTDRFPGDNTLNPHQRQTPGLLYSLVAPLEFPDAKLLGFNQELATQLHLSRTETEALTQGIYPKEVQPYATAYAGHQFGNWAGQLGDGRAIFLGETETEDGPLELQWKGIGATPYSRHADGRAVLRSSVREYLMSEAIYRLGIPGTRALALAATGDKVVRDIMYDGNPKEEPGAVIVRTAESFIRFGHFEFLTATNDVALLQDLADWCITRYFPEVENNGVEKYLNWFRAVAERTAEMIVGWYRVGFVHGVMNTDNMSILGLTIDYGPFSMLDAYDLNFTPNTTDLPGRRYSFGRQANIAHWNLYQLANAIFPLIKDQEALQQVLDEYGINFWKKYDRMMADKLGLDEPREADTQLFTDWQKMMDNLKPDYTLFFTALESFEPGADVLTHFGNSFYTAPTKGQREELENFLQNYLKRKQSNAFSAPESRSLMQRSNPKFILRNYQLYEAIRQLENGDDAYFQKLWEALQTPYEERYPELCQKKPGWADGMAGCGMLSCSS